MLSIDITDKQLKLVKGALTGSKIRIDAVGTRDVPDGSIVNGYVTDIPIVAGEVTDMLNEMKISDKEIIVCINSSSILYKELEVPKPKTLKNSAAIEAAIIAQMGISSDYNVSYSVVGDGAGEDGAATMKLIATACPQRMVDGYQALFKQLGMNLKQINISNNCITRLILNTPKLKDVMPFLCIQVDVDFININLYEEGQVALSRYVKIDPSDYENNPDYINIAVFDNLFRMIQFIGQRPGSKPLKQIMFYGVIKDFVALSNSIMSFNIPSHVLSMPSNIVKKCDVEFARYANAIGAFYKVDPLLEHINLLESKAVKSKQGANLFPLKVLLAAGVGAAAVFAVFVIFKGTNSSIESDIKKVEQQIKEGNFDARRSEMDLAENVLTKFSGYEDSVKIAKVLFDFLPHGDLPQIREQLEAGLKPEYHSDPNSFYAFSKLEWTYYTVKVKVYCSSNEFPANYVEALNKEGFFEDIVYEGFRTVTGDRVESDALAAVPAGSSDVIEFDVTMRLKGGHVFDGNGNKYSPAP